MIKQDANELLDEVLLENRVPLKDIYNCAKQNFDELEKMMDIFEHKNDRDWHLCLGSVGLLARDQSDRVMSYYCRAFNLDQAKYLCGNIPREDVVLLLTACVYNPVFFSFALDASEDIQNRLAVEDERRREFNIVEMPGYSADGRKAFVALQSRNREWRNAASKDGWKEYFSKDIFCDKFSGKFEFFGNHHKQVYIKFWPAEDKVQENIPYEIEFCFTTTRDPNKMPHRILADMHGRERGRKYIYSLPVDGVDYEGGIEANYTVSFFPVKKLQVEEL